MALNFNGNTPKKVNINIKNSGIKHVARVIINGVVVWLEKVLTLLTGYLITLTNSVGDDLVDYKIYGESVQDSTPTPDNPIENEGVGEKTKNYEPYGYKIPVKVSGKNLFDKTKFSSIGYLNYDGSHVYQYNWKISDYIVINGVDYITETYPLLGGSVAYTCFYDSNKNFLSSKLQGNVTNKTIDIPQGSVYMRFCYKIADENDVQVEVGTQSTSYEPYVEPIITNIYLNEPLRKLGDYIDYVDFENKKVIRNVFCRTFTGGETINVPGTTIEGYTPFRFIDSVDISYPFVCNYLPFVNSNYGSVTNRECLARYSSSGKQMFFVISNQRIPLNDTTAFKNWLKELYSSGKPIKVYAGLNTPTEETIELPNIPTHEGTNIIEIDTTIQPSNMEVQYYAKEV